MLSWMDSFKANLLEVLYRPDQPRDELGRWTAGGNGGSGGLEEAELTALKDYAYDGYTGVNGYLRGMDYMNHWDPADVESVKANIAHLDSAMEKQGITEPTTLYRFVGDDVFEQIAENGRFQDEGFVSTSRSLDGLEGFVDLKGDPPILEIMVDAPPPLGGVDINAAGVAKYAEEQEVLLDRGLQFDVVERVGNRLKLRVSGK